MKKARIIVTDDDRDDYDLIVSVFADLGLQHDFTYAENGACLIDLLKNAVENKSGLPDLVILDLNMPKVNGFKALGIIKSNQYLASVPVLVYTTANCTSEKEKCYALGADGFATKACSLKKMTDFVSRLNAFLNNEGRLPGERPKSDRAKIKLLI